MMSIEIFEREREREVCIYIYIHTYMDHREPLEGAMYPRNPPRVPPARRSPHPGRDRDPGGSSHPTVTALVHPTLTAPKASCLGSILQKAHE